jgi:hypothetical protein
LCSKDPNFFVKTDLFYKGLSTSGDEGSGRNVVERVEEKVQARNKVALYMLEPVRVLMGLIGKISKKIKFKLNKQPLSQIGLRRN